MVWINVLLEAGIVAEVPSEDGQVIAWALTRKGDPLLDAQPDAAIRLALFQVHEYRIFLIGILAEGMAQAAKAGMFKQLETWTGDDLVSLLPEINAIFDSLESEAGRLIDASRDEIENRCAKLPGRDLDFSNWNQILLGRSGRPQDLFDFVLRKFAPAAMLTTFSQGEETATVLRHIPLTSEDGPDPNQVFQPGCWSTRRHRIMSGIPLFDEHGQSLHNSDLLESETIRLVLQDALVEHPFYRAVVYLTICAWRSNMATMPVVELKVSTNNDLGHTKIFVDYHDKGLLRERLPEFVGLQGLRVLGLPAQGLSSDLMENVLRNLLHHELLLQVEDEIQLHPEYQASLMAERLRTVFRPSKEIHKRMLEILVLERPGIAGGMQ